MTEQKAKKGGIAKMLKKNILAPCIKSTKVKENKKHDKHDLDNIDNGTLSFDSTKYLKKKNSDVDTINTNYDTLKKRRSNAKTESPLTSESDVPDSYLKRKSQTPTLKTGNEGKGKAEFNKQAEIHDVESDDSEDDVPLSKYASKDKPTPAANSASPIKKEDINEKVEGKVEGKVEEKVEEKDNSNTAKNPTVSMPTPVDEIKHKIFIPTKMEPTHSDMASHVSPDAINQSIPMPVPSEAGLVEEPTDINLSSSDYIIEEIVTEEIVNGKKKITTQTITRKASPKMNHPAEKPPIKMPVAVGPKAEKIMIPAKMTPTETEITPETEGITNTPMTLPKPSVPEIDTSAPSTSNNNNTPNLVESPLSKIVNDNEHQPSAISIPLVPTASEMNQNNITGNIIGSPLSSEPQSIETGFNLATTTATTPNTLNSVEPGFNVAVNSEDTKYMNVPASQENFTLVNPVEIIKPVDPEFITNAPAGGPIQMPMPMPAPMQVQMPMPMPMPVNGNNNNYGIDLTAPTVPNLANNDAEVRKTAQQKGYLEIPQPLPPSTFEESDNEDNRSDISHGSRKKMVNSPKTLTIDEELKLREQLEEKERIEHEQAIILESEKPLILPIPMPKTPSTFYKNNNISCDEKESKSSEEVIKIQTPVTLPENVKTENVNVISPDKMESKKIKLTVVNKDDISFDDDDSTDDEQLLNIKQQYEQKKSELEAKIANINDTILLSPELKEEIEENKEPIKEDVKENKNEEVKENKITEGENSKKLEEPEKDKKTETLEQTEKPVKEHVPQVKINEEVVAEVKNEKQNFHVVEPQNGTVAHRPSYASSEGSFQDNLMGSLKRTNGAKSIKSFFGFGKKNKKDKKNKKNLHKEEEDIPQSPENNLKVEIPKKKNSVKESHSPFASLKRLVSPLSGSKRRASNSSIKSSKSKKTSDVSERAVPTETTTNATTTTTTTTTNKITPEVPTKDEVKQEVKDINNNEDAVIVNPSLIKKPGILKPTNDMKQVISDIQTQARAPVKFEIPLEALEKVESKEKEMKAPAKKNEKENEEDDSSSVYSSSSSASTSSTSSASSSSSSATSASDASSTSSASSTSTSSSSDNEVLGNTANKTTTKTTMTTNTTTTNNTNNNFAISEHDHDVNVTTTTKTEPIPINNNNNNNRDINESSLTRNYTNGNVDNDDFVSIMMVQRMLSSSVDRSSQPSSPVSRVGSPTYSFNSFNFIDVEAEKKKSYSKPKAVITTVNPHVKQDSAKSPKSTIVYHFDDKPKIEKTNFYKNDYVSRSVGSLPMATENKENTTTTLKNKTSDYSPKQRMIELNLDNSILFEDRDKNNKKNNNDNENNGSSSKPNYNNNDDTDSENGKSTLYDSNLMKMFEDIHNLSLDDIANLYSKPSQPDMIQCDIGPSFLDEVMGSLTMK